MRKQLCALGVIAGSCLLPAIARAEDEPKAYPECTKAPTESETAAAKGAYQAGNASFDEADYPRAITYWEDAYRRDCTANLLLKNLARAYELYGQKRQAVVALETFLVRVPDSGDKEQIQRRIEVLKKQITTEKAAPPPAGTQPQQQTATTPPPSTTQEPPATPPETHFRRRPIAPLVVAGAGGVAVIVGGIVFLAANKDVNHYADLCMVDNVPHNCGTGPTATANASAANSARSRKVVGGIVTGVGAAAIAGGLLWYFLSPTSTTTSTASAGTLVKPRVDPAVTPGFAGLALSGAF